jgi:glycosyltransferase involved in cell wall biosynthesis
MRVFFYPHRYLRDRHLDTIRRWPSDQAINAQSFTQRRGAQVQKSESESSAPRRSWQRRLPLLNMKRRPRGLAPDDVVYVWGAVMATGPFIVDLDNPYALTGYNASALTLWRGWLRRMLLAERCREVRCLSEACRSSLATLLGADVAAKAVVIYPRIDAVASATIVPARAPRFLFIGTQFEIKGGEALLRAFADVRAKLPGATLDVITHLPPSFREVAAQPGVTVHEAGFRREELWERYLRHADVLVHPSYIESFGMVVLEAIAHGLAVVANDVYAHREMVIPQRNGVLLVPPVRYWNNNVAGPLFREEWRARDIIRATDMREYTRQLTQAMCDVAASPERLRVLRQQSRELFEERFATPRDRS